MTRDRDGTREEWPWNQWDCWKWLVGRFWCALHLGSFLRGFPVWVEEVNLVLIMPEEKMKRDGEQKNRESLGIRIFSIGMVSIEYYTFNRFYDMIPDEWSLSSKIGSGKSGESKRLQNVERKALSSQGCASDFHVLYEVMSRIIFCPNLLYKKKKDLGEYKAGISLKILAILYTSLWARHRRKRDVTGANLSRRNRIWVAV